MPLRLSWDGDARFIGENEGGARITMEPGPAFGGSGKYPTPMELLAFALGGCTGMDVIFILQKMRVDLKKLDIVIETTRRKKEPRYFEEIKMVYLFSGEGLTEAKARRAVDLSNEKYCSAGVMLREKAKITYDIRIE